MSDPVRTHDLKTWPSPFADVIDGRKTFEVRCNDRGFVVGDVLRLREWIPAPDWSPARNEGRYTGREHRVRVTYVFTDGAAFGLVDGYVVLGIAAAQAPAGADLGRVAFDALREYCSREDGPGTDEDLAQHIAQAVAAAVRSHVVEDAYWVGRTVQAEEQWRAAGSPTVPLEEVETRTQSPASPAEAATREARALGLLERALRCVRNDFEMSLGREIEALLAEAKGDGCGE